MNVFEYREQTSNRNAVSWDLVDSPSIVVTEQRIEPQELERLKAEWLGREHGTSDRVG